MVFPLVPLAIGGFAASAGANLYKQHVQRKMYAQFEKGYRALDVGYRSYLAKHGRRINPNRALTSYYGNYLRSRTNQDVSMASSVGSVGGAIGAGGMIAGKTYRMIK